MLKVTQIKCRPGNPLSREDIAGKLRCLPSDILSFEADRESIDARKEELYFVYSVYASVKNEEKYLRLKDVVQEEKPVYNVPVMMKKKPAPAGCRIRSCRDVCRTDSRGSRMQACNY